MADTELVSGKQFLEAPSAAMLARPRIARTYRWLALATLATDVLSLEIALIVVRGLGIGLVASGLRFVVMLVVASVVWGLCFAGFRLYEPGRLAPAEEFRRSIAAVGVGVIVVGVVLRMLVAPLRGTETVLRLDLLLWTSAITLVLVIAFRRVIHRMMWRLRRTGVLSYRTIIVGTNEEAIRIGRTLSEHAHGYRPIGMVHVGGQSAPLDGPPLLGTLDDLSSIIRSSGAECAFIASSAVSTETMKAMIGQLRRHDVEIRVSANLAEILTSRLTLQPVGDIMAMSLRPVRLTGSQAALKRAFDTLVASVGLLVASPVLLASAAFIKLTSRGPAIYRQDRIGRHGEVFRIYKLRTMVIGAELLVDGLRSESRDSGPLFKIDRDPRITRVGRWLRKWSIDEIPQLLNVIKGDMSLVGPRPMPAIFGTHEYEDWQRGRWEVLPGVTGLWQISGRNELTFDDCVRLDLFYIENWSLTYDAYILLKTIPAVLFRKGAM